MTTIELRNRYGQLKEAAIATLKEFNRGYYYAPWLDFESTRRYPYPLLRYAIGDMMYYDSFVKGEGVTLQDIASCMGKGHSNLSIGIANFNRIKGSDRIADIEKVRIINEFYRKVEMHNESPKESSLRTAMKKLADMAKDFVGTGRNFTSESEFYKENDDTAIYLFIN